MEISIIAILLTGIGSLIYLAYVSMRRPKSFPPGPIGIPFLGSIHYLTSIPFIGMEQMAKKYGNVFSVKLFHINVVCVNGYEAIKELFVKRANAICDRAPSMTTYVKGEPPAGIVEGQYGPAWNANRKIFHQTIRELGGTHGIENRVQKEVAFMVQELEQIAANKPIDPANVVSIGVLNVMAAVVFGNRFEYTDEKILRLLSLNNEALKRFEMSDWTVHLVTVYPQLKKIWVPKAVKEFVAVERKLYEFFRKEIDDRKNNFDPQSPRDYIDYYLIKLKENPDEPKVYSEHQISISIMDLFQAGSDTTATTLRTAVLYLAGNQKMQRKIYKEVEDVVGNEEPRYEHRLTMPFTEAFIHEIIRISSAIPAGLFRVAVEDTELLGFNIPKGTYVWPHMRSSNFDPDQWKTVNEFDPENFLDENGNFVLRDALFAFGGGVRVCLGMSVAKRIVFLFTVSLLQRFIIKPEKDGMKMDYEQIPGLTMNPKPFKIRLEDRA